tara:strand:+ start:1799 stop:2122 length:324 start_codon:yes stop_codon:yes gene_type:complete
MSNIFYGSMTHSYNGKKRKTTAYRRKKSVPPLSGKPLQVPDHVLERQEAARKHREQYPSLGVGTSKYVPQESQDYKKEISKQYTVAPAYNKGAYQVINPDNIVDIGK